MVSSCFTPFGEKNWKEGVDNLLVVALAIPGKLPKLTTNLNKIVTLAESERKTGRVDDVTVAEGTWIKTISKPSLQPMLERIPFSL